MTYTDYILRLYLHMKVSERTAIRAASKEVSHEVKTLMDTEAIDSFKQTQHLLLGRLQDSNASDLDYIFLKLRNIKSKIFATYPDAFPNESLEVVDTGPDLEFEYPFKSKEYEVTIHRIVQIPQCKIDFALCISLPSLLHVFAFLSSSFLFHFHFQEALDLSLPPVSSAPFVVLFPSIKSVTFIKSLSFFQKYIFALTFNCAIHSAFMSRVVFNSPFSGSNEAYFLAVTRAVGMIKIGIHSQLFLGNLQPSRDLGFVEDYVEAMWLMLQQEKPDDYVVATEKSHSVEEFLEAAFGYVGLNWWDHV
ncbi:uncharacterized protein [Spinacia oleracea]|uniref:GDP-mannose 4,6-dehydratase n=1 Tax=Spinacia oleracea TaxID=3562 RepID=A0ABM3QGW9_SPIOL|nr:uncharacterized protein LOC130459322 [Spinacia oleracea]